MHMYVLHEGRIFDHIVEVYNLPSHCSILDVEELLLALIADGRSPNDNGKWHEASAFRIPACSFAC